LHKKLYLVLELLYSKWEKRDWRHFKYQWRELTEPRKQRYIQHIIKQVFIRDYIYNAQFPTQSEVVRLIRTKCKENNIAEFEYKYESKM